MKVKICGIKDIETALFTAEQGADFIGLNFSPESKRKTDISTAEKIIFHLRKNFGNKTEIVLLFFRNSEEEIRNTISSLEYDRIQFVARDETWKNPGLDKNILLPQISVEKEISDSDLDSEGDLVILDSFHKTMGGGTGTVFPWSYVKHLKRKYLLAGGITPKNLNLVRSELNPFGVDTASGVESSPGVKDRNLIREFIRNAKGISAS